MESFAEIERKFLTVRQVAEEAGVPDTQVHNWAKYYRYFEFSYLMGKPLVRRADFEKFKQEHPELINRESAQVA